MKISSKILLLATLAIGACSSNGQNISLSHQKPTLSIDKILANHIAATGGEENYAALQDVLIETEVIEPGFTVTGPYNAHKDGRMRVDIFMEGKRVFSEGIDEAGGWQQGGEGAEIKPIGTDGYNALYRGLNQNLYGFHDAERRGQRITLLGRQQVENVNYYVIKSIDADGFEQNYFINPDSWLIERRRETSALHPDLDPTKTASEKIYSDYREVCGLKKAMATRTIDLRSGKETQRTRALRYRCNVPDEALRLSRQEAPRQD